MGRFRDLEKAGVWGDNLTAHHAPSAKFLAQYGISKGDGVAFMMEHPVPGKGGRHRQTRTYGSTKSSSLPPRQELARDIADLRGIYQQEGMYTPEIRDGLIKLISENKKAHPDLFHQGGTQ